MDLRLATVSPPADLAAWGDAYRRVVALLRAYRFRNAMLRNLRAQEIVAEARGGDLEERDPTARAIAVARHRIRTWARDLARAAGGSDEEFSEAAFLTILQATRVTERWPEHVLGAPPFPEELVETLRQTRIAASPSLHRTSFGQPQIDFPRARTFAADAGRLLQRWSLLRLLLGYGAAAGFFAALFYFAL